MQSGNPVLRGRIALAILGAVSFLALPACSGPDHEVTARTPSLSDAKRTPGQYLTVFHPSIRTGDVVAVQFFVPDLFAINVQGTASEIGAVRLVTPPYLEADGRLGSGVVQVGLPGIAGSAMLQVEELPTIPGLTPGMALRTIYEELLVHYQSARDDVTTTVFAGSESVDPTALLAGIDAQLAGLQAALAQLNEGSLEVRFADGRTAILGAAELELADRLVVAVINGGLEQLQLETIPVVRAKSLADPPPFDQEAANRNVQTSIRNLMGVPALGINMGTVAVGTVGIGLTLFGLAASAEGLVFIGLFSAMLATGEALYNVATGPVLAKSTAAFKGCEPEQFDVGVQMLQDANNMLTDGIAAQPLPDARSPLFVTPGPIGELGDGILENTGAWSGGMTGLAILRDGNDVYQAYTQVRCIQQGMEDGPEQKTLAEECDVAAFCAVVRPGTDPDRLCTDTCSFAGNGACDDGGEGSTSAVCSFGTDCQDCGGRVAGDEPDQGDPTPDCAPDGSCNPACTADSQDPDCATSPGDGSGSFQIVTYVNVDGSSGSEASAANIQLSGSPTHPTIRFAVESPTQLAVYENGTGNYLYWVVNGYFEDQNGETVIVPIVSPLTYGDYSRPDAFRPDAGMLAGLPETAPPLAANTPYVVLVVDQLGRSASLVFSIR